MQKLFLAACLITLFAGCKKAIEHAQENALNHIIVDGRWKVSSFIKGAGDITGNFALYEFQFHDNNKVDAYKNGSIEQTGYWQGDISSKSITSEFPSTAKYPLGELNGVWRVTDSGLTFVKATETINGEVRMLRLDKK